MKDLTVQDWAAIIASIVAIGGVLMGLGKYLYRKFAVKPANLRANFFKSNKTWILRIFNSSSTDIEATNIQVHFPECDGFIPRWKCDADEYPSLKRHAAFDIHVALCTSAPDTLPVNISWRQGKKQFSTTEVVQLR